MKVLFDINVILDIVAHREPFYADSRAAYLKVLELEGEVYLSVHAVATIYYLLGTFADRQKRRRAMDWVLDSFRIAGLTEQEVGLARTYGMGDFEDALVVAAASREGCGVILTRNIADFRNSPLSAQTPTDFLSLFS